MTTEVQDPLARGWVTCHRTKAQYPCLLTEVTSTKTRVWIPDGYTKGDEHLVVWVPNVDVNPRQPISAELGGKRLATLSLSIGKTPPELQLTAEDFQ